MLVKELATHFATSPPEGRQSIVMYVSVCVSVREQYPELHVRSSPVVIPAKVRDYVFTGVGLSVCLSVCYHDN